MEETQETTIELRSEGEEELYAATEQPTVEQSQDDQSDVVSGPINIKIEKLTENTSEMYQKQQQDGNHFEIHWRNLDYVLESKWYRLASQRNPILNGLSGTFKSGELSAVLGPSGAGKSTLIDCLMGKRERGLSGRTWVKFRDPQVEKERRSKRPLKIATIPQQDHLLDSLTVTETFMFASKIKNAHLRYEEEDEDSLATTQDLSLKDSKSRSRRKFDHFKNVQRVIQQLNLSSCASVKCGKLSGGQYKRVSIGQELLSRPDIMILDEPTSGLDSVTCFQTISALRKLIECSAYPIAIVATIHQPDIEVFQLFHRAYVLAAGGRAIYEGPTGDIFDRVQMACDLVEARRKKLAPLALANRSMISQDEREEQLKLQLSQRSSNPARLIVELAANEYGYEITTALNELVRATYSSSSSIGGGEHGSTLTLPLGECNSNSGDSNSASGSSSSTSGQMESDFNSEEQLAPRSAPAFDYEFNNPKYRKADQDKLLRLSRAKSSGDSNSIGVFFKHLWQHTKRSWLTIVRDPMLFSVQVALHIFVPLLISYSFQSHRGDACPKVGPLDVVKEAFRRDGDVLSDLNSELRVAFENLGYMFFQIYVIIFAAVCVTSLTYPLVMHVLLKEYRNGWYSMSSYFLGRTLADLPVPTFNVVLAMAISYHLTGQPLSPYGWRFLSVSALTVLATLVAQTQGLMFGAMLMNAPQAAVFVAPASTAPLVVVSGFLIRIRSLPFPLQILSQFSYFTHLLNGFIVSRYGFNRCPCEESDFAIDPAHQVPAQARAIIDLWIDTFADDFQTVGATNSTLVAESTIGESGGGANINLVGKLVDTIGRAKTFGFEMQTCDQVKPFTMLDYELNDSHLIICFVALIMMLVIYRWLTYIVLMWKINSSI